MGSGSVKFSKNISVASNKLEGVVIILDLGVVVGEDMVDDRVDVVIEMETRSNSDVTES